MPPIILERLIEQAVEKCRTSAAVSHVGQSAVRRNTVILGALVAAAVLLLSIGPEFFRQGASALLVLSRDAAAASPCATAEAMYSKCAVAPRIRQPSAMTAA